MLLLLLLHHLGLNSRELASTLLLHGFALPFHKLVDPHFGAAFESKAILLCDVRRILRGRSVLPGKPVRHLLPEAEKSLMV